MPGLVRFTARHGDLVAGRQPRILKEPKRPLSLVPRCGS